MIETALKIDDALSRGEGVEVDVDPRVLQALRQNLIKGAITLREPEGYGEDEKGRNPEEIAVIKALGAIALGRNTASAEAGEVDIEGHDLSHILGGFAVRTGGVIVEGGAIAVSGLHPSDDHSLATWLALSMRVRNLQTSQPIPQEINYSKFDPEGGQIPPRIKVGS
ncbi:heme-binding protein [Candidatus Saccharibacteria bacterium]|nr:heme-binding protein [Candidatus Saccharibacteria bacterium]